MSGVRRAGTASGWSAVRRAAWTLCCWGAFWAPGCGASEEVLIPETPAPPPSAPPRPLGEARQAPDAESSLAVPRAALPARVR
jgi:hypothetical protein